MRRKFVRSVDQFRLFSSHWIFCRESIDTGKPTIKKKEILRYVIVIYFSKNVFFVQIRARGDKCDKTKATNLHL